MSLDQAMQSTAVAIQAASNSAGAALSRREAKKQIEADRVYNAEQARLARDWSTSERLASQEFNLDMWNKNNEYNSPIEQLKRLKEAGINPNMLGSNPNESSSPVTTSAGSSSMASNSSGASYVAPSMSQSANMLTALGNYQNQVAQSRNINIKSDWDSKTFEDRVKQVSESTKEIQSRYKLNDEQTKQVAELNNWVAQKSKAELDLMLAQLNNEKQTLNLLKAQTDTEKERKELVDAQTYTEISRDGLYEEQIAGQDIENERSELAKKQEELKSKFSEITGIPYDSNDFQLAYYLWEQDKFEDYIYFVLSKGATDNGSGILNDVMDFFGKVKNYKNPKMGGKRTTTESIGPKGRTYSTSTTIPI